MSDVETVRTKIQLAVEFTSQSNADDIQSTLKNVDKGVSTVKVDHVKQMLVVESTLPSQDIVKIIESTGIKAIVTGVEHAGGSKLGSAVAIMHEGNPSSGIRGVTRLIQTSMDTCVVDGTLDGLQPKNNYQLAIHEYGDLSDGCDSCGDIMSSSDNTSPSNLSYGLLGMVNADNNGRASFRLVNHTVKVWDVIGRSMVLSHTAESKFGIGVLTKLACGVIARSAGLFENAKKICACDGVTIWDEREVPAAGTGRQSKTPNSNL